MVVAESLYDNLKFTYKNTFHGLKAYSLHLAFIIIYQESKSEILRKS